MSRVMLDALFHELEIVPDSEGYARFDSGGVLISLEYDEESDRLYLYSSLGSLPSEPPRALYERMLEANFLGAGTDGGHIGLHGATRIVTYSLSLNVDRLDARALRNALNLFARRAVGLMEDVNALCSEAEEKSLFSGPILGAVLWG